MLYPKLAHQQPVGGAIVSEGQDLALVGDPGESHFFDPESGRRVADL